LKGELRRGCDDGVVEVDEEPLLGLLDKLLSLVLEEEEEEEEESCSISAMDVIPTVTTLPNDREESEGGMEPRMRCAFPL
jgi:hypothetical protein